MLRHVESQTPPIRSNTTVTIFHEISSVLWTTRGRETVELSCYSCRVENVCFGGKRVCEFQKEKENSSPVLSRIVLRRAVIAPSVNQTCYEKNLSDRTFGRKCFYFCSKASTFFWFCGGGRQEGERLVIARVTWRRQFFFNKPVIGPPTADACRKRLASRRESRVQSGARTTCAFCHVFLPLPDDVPRPGCYEKINNFLYQ